MAEKKELIIREKAAEDLVEQIRYYVEAGAFDFATELHEKFYDQIRNILPDYLRFPECRFLLTKKKIYRNIVWGHYLIVFKIKPATIEILCLHHTRKNPRKIRVLRGK